MKISLKTLLIVALGALLVGASQQVSATIIAADDFSTDGALAGTTPDVGSNWTAHSGAGNMPLQVTGGAAILHHGSGSREDANIDWADNFRVLQAADVVYAGFDFSVAKTDDNPMADVYFAHMKDSGNLFSSRVWLTSHAQGDFTVAITPGTLLSQGTVWTAPLSLGQTYRAVHAYNYDTGVSTLWVDPVNEASINVAATITAANGAALQQYALRQAAGNANVTIDNLLVATTFAEALGVPEPSTIAYVALGLVGLIATGGKRRLL